MTRSPLEIALAVLGREAAGVEQIASGRSGAGKYRVRTVDGDSVFMKVADRDAGERQRDLLRREVAVMSQLPEGSRVPMPIGFIDVDEITASVTEWIDGTSSATWNPRVVVAAVDAVRELGEDLAGVTLDLRRLSEDATRFRTFSRRTYLERSASLGPQKAEWLAVKRHRLVELELEGRERMRDTRLLHCDLAVDNVILRPSGKAVLVDWSHAALGHPAFDLAALFIRARADGADGPRLMQLVEEVAEPGSWESMLALATGMFLEVSRGERERPSDSLSAQRSRYSRAGIDLLQEALS